MTGKAVSARSVKSNFLIANAIAWAGVTVTALIGIYGPHGPPRHPKMMSSSVLLVAVLLCAFLHKAKASKLVLFVKIALWTVAFFAGVLIANTDLGDGLNPLATPIIFVVLGIVASCLLAAAKIPQNESVAPDVEQ